MSFGSRRVHRQGVFFRQAISSLAVFCAMFLAAQADDTPAGKQASSSLVDQIFSSGVQIQDGFSAEIGQPTLMKVPSDQRLEAARELAPRMPWTRFSQDSVFAPVVIKTVALDGPDGNRVAYHVQSAFLVHASLKQLEDQELMKAALMSSKKDDSGGQEGTVVTDAELAKAGIKPPAENVSFGKVAMPLLNRVSLAGVIQAEKFDGLGYLGVAWQMDPRFEGTELGCRWRLMTKNDLGQPELGPANDYQGCGGFITVFEVQPNLLLVESKFVMHEPKGWFNGSQLLRSKLPPALQENARSFRRSIANAQK